jgi:hypothetical protein
MANNYTQLTDKLELIFWPYLRLTFLFVASFGLLDAALLHWLPGFDPPYLFWKLLAPAVVAAVLVLWLLWSRLRLLAKTKGRGNLAVGMSLIAVITIAFSTGCLHDYLRVLLGRLEVVESPAALADGRSRGTYYRFRHKYQTARYAGAEPQSTTGDKGRTVIFHLYVATPLFASPAEMGQPATCWQGLHYSAQLDAHASDTEKQAAWQAFLRRSDSLFAQESFIAPAGYYERIPNTDERAAYLRAARHTMLCPPNTASPIVLLQPGQEPFTTLERNNLYHLAGWLSGGSALFLIILLFPYLSATSAQAFRARHS